MPEGVCAGQGRVRRPGERMIARAKAAVAELRRWTERHQQILDGHEGYARSIAEAAEEASHAVDCRPHHARRS